MSDFLKIEILFVSFHWFLEYLKNAAWKKKKKKKKKQTNKQTKKKHGHDIPRALKKILRRMKETILSFTLHLPSLSWNRIDCMKKTKITFMFFDWFMASL